MKEAPMKLKDLIAELEKCDQNSPVLFADDNRIPSRLISWRGSYSELSIDSEIDGPAVKTSEFLKQCKEAIGATFEGYKGGDFVMSEDSLVYADEYSTSSCVAACGIVERGGRTLIETIMVNHY